MLEIGKKAWCRFVNIVKYPEFLDEPAITCNDQPTIRWPVSHMKN